MNCTVNGKEHDLPANMNLEELIRHIGLQDAVCAAEVDKKLVPKRERAACILQDGQTIEIVTLVGGG